MTKKKKWMASLQNKHTHRHTHSLYKLFIFIFYANFTTHTNVIQSYYETLISFLCTFKYFVFFSLSLNYWHRHTHTELHFSHFLYSRLWSFPSCHIHDISFKRKKFPHVNIKNVYLCSWPFGKQTYTQTHKTFEDDSPWKSLS